MSHHPNLDFRQPGNQAAPAAMPAGPTLVQLYPRLARYRTYLIAGLCVFLVWVILTRGLSAYLAETSPAAALWLDPGQPEALTRLADDMLKPASAAGAGTRDVSEDRLHQKSAAPKSTEQANEKSPGPLLRDFNAVPPATSTQAEALGRARRPQRSPRTPALFASWGNSRRIAPTRNAPTPSCRRYRPLDAPKRRRLLDYDAALPRRATTRRRSATPTSSSGRGRKLSPTSCRSSRRSPKPLPQAIR